MSDPNSSPIVRFGRWLGAIVFLIAAPLSAYFFFQIFRTARESAAWPSVPGTIIRAEVRAIGFGRYRADVSYEYVVAGRQFFGERIRAGDGEHNGRAGAVKAIEGLAPGQTVKVYYDAADPARSVLRGGAGFQEYALLFVPVVVFAIGFGSVQSLRNSRV